MRKSRFTDEQIVVILREADRDPMPIVAKRHGISEQTIYTWRKRFGTFQADDVRRLKQLEVENARLAEHASNLAVVEPIGGGDYLYIHYGRTIFENSGVEMLGSKVSQWKSEVGTRYARVALNTIREIQSPLELLSMEETEPD